MKEFRDVLAPCVVSLVQACQGPVDPNDMAGILGKDAGKVELDLNELPKYEHVKEVYCIHWDATFDCKYLYAFTIIISTGLGDNVNSSWCHMHHILKQTSVINVNKYKIRPFKKSISFMNMRQNK